MKEIKIVKRNICPNCGKNISGRKVKYLDEISNQILSLCDGTKDINAISKEIKKSYGATHRHLERLKKEGKVSSMKTKEKGCSRYFKRISSKNNKTKVKGK